MQLSLHRTICIMSLECSCFWALIGVLGNFWCLCSVGVTHDQLYNSVPGFSWPEMPQKANSDKPGKGGKSLNKKPMDQHTLSIWTLPSCYKLLTYERHFRFNPAQWNGTKNPQTRAEWVDSASLIPHVFISNVKKKLQPISNIISFMWNPPSGIHNPNQTEILLTDGGEAVKLNRKITWFLTISCLILLRGPCHIQTAFLLQSNYFEKI